MEKTLHSVELDLLLSKGADERIFLNQHRLTKYGLPLVSDDILNRGSCTCSPAREADAEMMQEVLAECESLDDWLQLKHRITRELKQELNWDGEDNFEIFYAPSGTDLVYIPLMFGRLLHANQPILNIITCIEELGSGTRFAAREMFHADFNQFGEPIRKMDPVLKDGPIETIFFNARSVDGEILDNATELKKQVRNHPDHLVIINLAYGTKSGIEDDLRLIDVIDGEHIMWVVDLCQFRHSKNILNMLLGKNALVMITGSKFYESPPFSGAMLVPKTIYQKLQAVDNWHAINGYGKIFSSFDFPTEIREKLEFNGNFNLAGTLRWLCALEEIKKYNALPAKRVEEKIDQWREVVFRELEARPEFELMPHQKRTNKTIVSFRVKFNGQYLNREELQKLYFSIVTDNYSDTYRFKRIMIGQPVSYGDKVFLRLAIGSKTIRWMVENDETDFPYDKDIISIIEAKLHQLYENHS